MEKRINTFIILVVGICMYACSSSSNKLTPEKLGWKLGVQAYTFRKFTFFQAVNKAKQLGLHYIEAWPGQKAGGGIEGNMKWTNLNKAARKKIKDYLKKQRVNMIAYGVVVPHTKAQWDSLFTFAHQMDIKNITAAPQKKHLGHIAELCKKYHINVAIHDEPRPGHFWNPDSTLAAIQAQHSPCIGAAADVGNWVRSGIHPVKALKKLKGHIIELHMKNEKTWGTPNEDVIWGKGVENMQEVVHTLYHQGFKGFIAVEYETHPENNIPEIKKSLTYFNHIVAKLK